MTLFGIDVSKWQSNLPDLSTCEFLFARASIGTTTDSLYAQHIAEAKAAGLVTGAYHFNWDTVPIAAQVTTFIAAAGDVDLYAVDVEGANAFSEAQTATFIQLMHAAGLKCGLYHSASGFFDAGQDWDWVAKWSTVPPASWDFWQYTSDGKLPGYTGRLDFDRFNGTLDELHALAGKDDMKVAKLTYYQRANAKAGKPVRDQNGNVIHTTPATYTGYPLIATDTDDYIIRLPGDEVGWIRKADVGSISEPGPVPPLPAPPDCAAQIAADRSKAYVAYKP